MFQRSQTQRCTLEAISRRAESERLDESMTPNTTSQCDKIMISAFFIFIYYLRKRFKRFESRSISQLPAQSYAGNRPSQAPFRNLQLQTIFFIQMSLIFSFPFFYTISCLLLVYLMNFVSLVLYTQAFALVHHFSFFSLPCFYGTANYLYHLTCTSSSFYFLLNFFCSLFVPFVFL